MSRDPVRREREWVPESREQIRWGVALTTVLLVLVAVFAFVPDPFHRQRVMTVGLDQVEGISVGAPVFFRGEQIGSVREIALVPARRTFDIDIGIRRDWLPSACSFMKVAASNPFTQPHLELVALETSTRACPTARAAASCDPIEPSRHRHDAMVGCKRSPDLIALATAAITQASEVAKTAGAMAARLQGMVGAGTASGGMAGDLQHSVKALADMMGTLDRSMAPGRGDIALTLANVKRASGAASRIDMGAVNETLGSVRGMVGENRAAIAAMLNNGQAISGQTRELLQSTSQSLAQTSANLARVSGSMDALVDRLSADPAYVVHGQKFADPPPVTKP